MTDPVERAGANSGMTSPSFLLFEVAGIPLATPAAQVDHVHDTLLTEPVEGTLPWFSGLAVADGKLLPITDLGELLGKPVAGGYTLQLNRDFGVAGIRVEKVMGLSKQPVTRSAPADALPDVLAAGVDDRCIAFRGRIHYLLDLQALLQSPQLLGIADEA